MTQDRPLLGILLMFGFCFLVPLSDSLAKLLGSVIPLGMLVFVRFVFQAAILAPIAMLTGRPVILRGRLLGFAYLRTVLMILLMALMFTSLYYLPLADAVAITFVMPFLLLIMGRIFLGEDVGLRRFAACAVGFVGTLLIIQPNFLSVGWTVLYPLGVAFFYAVFLLVTRTIAKETDPIGLQALGGFLGLASFVPIFAIAHIWGIPAFEFHIPAMDHIGLLVLMGITGTLAHVFMTWSLRYAPSTTLAPMQYVEIPIATVYGFFLFDELPNGLAAIGICITVAAGIYVILRERAMSRGTV